MWRRSKLGRRKEGQCGAIVVQLWCTLKIRSVPCCAVEENRLTNCSARSSIAWVTDNLDRFTFCAADTPTHGLVRVRDGGHGAVRSASRHPWC